MLGLGLNLGLSATGGGLPTIAGYRPLFHLTPYRDEDKTFSRASTATFIAADGDIESAAVNVLRNRDYSNGAAAILMEGQSTNDFIYSSDMSSFDASGGGNVALITTDSIIEDTSTSEHFAGSGISLSAGESYTFSFEYKPIGDRGASAGFVSSLFGVDSRPKFSDSGSVLSAAGMSNVTVESAGGGWFRASYDTGAIAATTSSSTFFVIQPIDGSNNSYTGDGTSGVMVRNVQIEKGNSVTSHIPTSGAAATRAADIFTSDVSGLDLSDGFWLVFKGALDGVFGSSDSVLQLGDAANSNSIIYSSGTSSLQAIQRASGADTASESFSYTLGDEVSLAVRYKADEFAAVWPDGSIVLDTSATFVEPSDLFIAASDGSGTNKPARASYEEILIYPSDITPEQMRSALGL